MKPRLVIASSRAPRPLDARGFTLVEVMVAIVILTVGLLSLAQMMVLATNSNALSGRMTSASALAKEQLERLKATPFYSDPLTRARNIALQDGGDVDVVGGAGYVQYYDTEGAPVAAGGALYEVRWQIETVANAPLPLEMIKIRVRCVPAAQGDRFTVIGEALFTTYRTANVG